jgi:hypothetical protein
MIPITPLLQQLISMQRLLLAMLANPQDLLAADRQLPHKPSSKVLKSRRPAKIKFLRGIRRVHRRFIKERLERQYSIRQPLL